MSSYVWGFKLLLVTPLRNVIAISNSEEHNLVFSFPREHMWCCSQLWFEATCCSVTNELPQSVLSLSPEQPKHGLLGGVWKEAVIEPITLRLLLHDVVKD